MGISAAMRLSVDSPAGARPAVPLALRGSLATLTLLLLLGIAPPASAADEEHVFSVAPRYATMIAAADGTDDIHGVGLSFGYRYGLTDFWTLLADATYAFFPAEVEHLSFVRVGATYTIDALEWVPWVGLAVGGYVLPDADSRFDGGASVGVGVDYRPQRGWSVGVDVWYHALFTHLDRTPATLTVGLRLSWYLR